MPAAIPGPASGPRQRITRRLHCYWKILLSVSIVIVVQYIAMMIREEVNAYTWVPLVLCQAIAFALMMRLCCSDMLSRPVCCKLLREPQVLMSGCCVVLNMIVDFTRWQRAVHISGPERAQWLCHETDTCWAPFMHTFTYALAFWAVILMDPLRFPARRLQITILICLSLVTAVNYFLHTTKKVAWPDFPLLQLGSSAGGGESETWRMGGHHVNVSNTHSNSTASVSGENEAGPAMVVITAFSSKTTVYSVIGTGLLNATVTAITDCNGKKLIWITDNVDRETVAVPETPERASAIGLELGRRHVGTHRSAVL